MNKLATIAKTQKVNRILIENNFGDGMFTQLMKPELLRVNYSVTIEEVRSVKQKELRIIDILEPALSNHRVIIDPRVIINDYKSIESHSSRNLKYSLFYQLSRLTRERGSLRHDDRLDALSMAVEYWVEQMARDIDEAVDELRDTRVRQELERFQDSVFGGKPKENLWVKL